MSGGRCLRIYGQACQYRPIALGTQNMATPIGLPAMPSESPLTPLPSSLPHPGSREPVTILMVDDQPSKLISYEVILADLNERLVKATSGREALDHLLKSDVAVVLMGVSMPEMDAFEL